MLTDQQLQIKKYNEQLVALRKSGRKKTGHERQRHVLNPKRDFTAEDENRQRIFAETIFGDPEDEKRVNRKRWRVVIVWMIMYVTPLVLAMVFRNPYFVSLVIVPLIVGMFGWEKYL
jgi:hypothetical protein